ncbi:CG6470 [Drosophila busckii]|uniref:CG6470 n=1 Tax=Drosophila busckii TaxID=30019 RepID=A0A0M4FAW2_DROBS|nr:uncharacterized protein LOC108605812 [Drosophila busckii]ALC50000.1 CG6470 [Drosophila busckii]
MKHIKSTPYQRNAKLQPYDNLDIDVENARKAVERKLNYLSESNYIANSSRALRRRSQRSSEGILAPGVHHRRKHNAKKMSQLKPKDDLSHITREKNVGLKAFFQSPRRNGLSPRDLFPDDEDEIKYDRSLAGQAQDQFDQNQNIANSNQRSQMSIKHIHKPTYSCSSCGAIFHIKSLLGAHRRTHDDDFKVRFRTRRPREDISAALTSAAIAASGKQCKFCDRVFDLERALRIHQMCHCNKITPQQRRKLGFTDLAHEKKNAPLPTFQRLPKGVQPSLPSINVPDPNMPYVALGPAALKMIEQEQQQKSKRRNTKYIVKAAGPMGRWR